MTESRTLYRACVTRGGLGTYAWGATVHEACAAGKMFWRGTRPKDDPDTIRIEVLHSGEVESGLLHSFSFRSWEHTLETAAGLEE